jgi:phosphate transport system permease protein
MLTLFFGALILLMTLGYVLGRGRSVSTAGGNAAVLHSRPTYHGVYVAAWVGLPALLVVFIWLFLQETIIEWLLIRSLPPEATAGVPLDLLMSQIKSFAGGTGFGEPSQTVLEAAERYARWEAIAGWSMFAAAIATALFGLVIARRYIAPAFRARPAVEKILTGLMILCSCVAILTTLGIILSLLFEAIRFFGIVSPIEFLFGLRWEPQIALRADQGLGDSGAFGAIPVFTGTLLIAGIALLVAVPIGLYSAIYLAEYAAPTVRSVIKPVLEILAGIPTVVFGFFAVLVIAPAMRDFGAMIGLGIAPNSALAAGLVMGIMIIPFVSSLSDDAISAVPRAMRDGSYAMGATKGETITRVLLPAALPGIMGGVLLATSRAIGETMIVVMAAGIIARLTLNPLEPVTTVTVQIVALLTGDTEFDNPKTLAAFALGLVLFIVTLALNIIALRLVQKYREKYD